MARKSMLTVQEELEAARQRELRARLRVQALKRRLSGEERRRAMQQRCALGGVLLALASRGDDNDRAVVAAVKRFLVENAVSNAHASNLAALVGTPFEVEGRRDA